MWLLAAPPAPAVPLFGVLALTHLVGTAAVNRITSNDGRQAARGVQSRGHQQPQTLHTGYCAAAPTAFDCDYSGPATSGQGRLRSARRAHRRHRPRRSGRGLPAAA